MVVLNNEVLHDQPYPQVKSHQFANDIEAFS